jgi:isochorismate synthase EntC
MIGVSPGYYKSRQPSSLKAFDGVGEYVNNPLTGTRPRANLLEQDEKFSRELFSNAKEVKEHALSIVEQYIALSLKSLYF